jgi:hypothetical protein
VKKSIAFVALGALLLLAGVAAACKSSDSGLKGRVSALETQVAQSNAAGQNTGMTLALQALAAAGMHEFETSVETGTLPPGQSGPVQRALAAVAAVQWPADLQSQAQDLQVKFQALLTALATDDLEQVKGPAMDAHTAFHEFADAVSIHLAEALGLPTAGGATPMGTAVETSMPMGTPTP